MQQPVADATAKKTVAAPLSIRHKHDFSQIVKIRRVYKQPQRFIDVLFYKIVEVTLRVERSFGVANDVVAIGNQTCTLCWAALQNL